MAWKTKTRWYNEGEKSNKYFLNLLKSNVKKAEMDKLAVDNIITTDKLKIKRAVNQYYSDLYNKNTNAIDDGGSFLDELFTLNEAEANQMNMPITLQELWGALKPLKDTAPGPDGITHIYLKKLWDIIGPLILDAWEYSIRQNKKTHSHERLIPKIGKDSTLLANWRPITLSNCDHKLITRVYNNRLVRILGNYIMNTQTAYLKTRNITDNIRIVNAAIQ